MAGIVHRDAPDNIMSQLDPQTTTVSYTECAHIIPEATFFGVNPKSEENSKEFSLAASNSRPNTQLDYSASILAVLKRFRYDITSFNGEEVHSLPNVITMGMDVHEAFDRLKLYFEATVSLALPISDPRYPSVIGYSLRRIVTRSNVSVATGPTLKCATSSCSQPMILNIFQSRCLSCLPCTLHAVRLLTSLVLLST